MLSTHAHHAPGLDQETRRLAVELLTQLLGDDQMVLNSPRRVVLPEEREKIFVFGAFTFDPRFRRVTRGREVIPLSLREYELLAALAARSGAPMSKSELRAEVWRGTIPVHSRSIDQHISELRRKLRFTDSDAPIETIRKFGYALAGKWITRDT
jgi:DNA-binding response OmpR family regulator